MKTWLLTWNPENWPFPNYKKLCLEISKGKEYTEPWSCSNTNVKPGDIVFFMKTGFGKRGIFASGISLTSSYKAEHYDHQKANEGIKTPHIDVKFLRLIDSNIYTVLEEDLLKEKFPLEVWSPLGSVIEIKEPIASELKELWDNYKETKKDAISVLEQRKSTVPLKHDGSYELMDSVIESYSKLPNKNDLDYNDLNLVYLITVTSKKENIGNLLSLVDKSNLPILEKTKTKDLIKEVFDKTGKHYYDGQVNNSVTVGIFGTGFYSFITKTDKKSVIDFITLCTEIKDETDEEVVYSLAKKVLVKGFRGMQAASASMVLHCLKPYIFPIMNSNMGTKNIFEELGIKLKSKNSLYTYIENCQKISNFKNEYFRDYNYRDFDLAAQELSLIRLNEKSILNEKKEKEDTEVESLKKNIEKNMILYGPPGTGKTYSSKIYAVSICDNKDVSSLYNLDYSLITKRYDELVSEGRVAFTTFHQSYGYEEFIEGIYPCLDTTSKDVSYVLKDGLFKAFCKEASSEYDVLNTRLNRKATVWKMSLGVVGDSSIKEDCFNRGLIRLDFNDDDNYQVLNDPKKGDIILSLNTRSSIDGIGVVLDDTLFELEESEYKRARKVLWLLKGTKIEIKDKYNCGKLLPIYTITKLPFMNVEKVIEILKENDAEIDTRKNDKNYVFIIDEINRGNISKILGELITLIEDTKRQGEKEEMSSILPYSGTKFSVPNNVYILGTMNTADRSIAILDTAIRRRFSFREMMPKSSVLSDVEVDGLNIKEMLDIMNDRITALYDREHTIGHSFFTKLLEESENTLDNLSQIFKNKILPLLQEYFYEDYSRIQLVLGDNEKTSDEYKFILDKENDVSTLFKGMVDDNVVRESSYEINDKAFDLIESYIEIIK